MGAYDLCIHHNRKQLVIFCTFFFTGYLREVDVLGEICFLMTSQAQAFHWPGYGLKLDIPPGVLPAGMKQCELLAMG